jgi:arylsulfatase
MSTTCALTVLDAAGIHLLRNRRWRSAIAVRGQEPLAHADRSTRRIFTEQYFEIFGNRAIYKDGWVAAAKRDYQPWNLLTDIPRVYADTTDQDHWELYHVATDFSEADDALRTGPAELKAEFEREGKRNDVFPLLPLPIGAPTLVDPAQRHFDYRSDISGLPTNALPALIGRPHRFEVELGGNGAAANGVLIAHGGRLGGHVLYLDHGRLIFDNNVFGQKHEVIAVKATLPPEPAKSASSSFQPRRDHRSPAVRDESQRRSDPPARRRKARRRRTGQRLPRRRRRIQRNLRHRPRSRFASRHHPAFTQSGRYSARQDHSRLAPT